MRNLMWAIVVVFLASCGDCGSGGNNEAKGHIEAEQTSLEFAAACPKPADPKYEVSFQTLPIVLHNTGMSTSYLNDFQVEAGFEGIFVVDQTKVPETVAQGDSVEIPITFKPASSGTVVARLHVAGDLADGSDTFEITLSGEGKNFDPVPKFSTTCQSPNTLAPSMDGCNPANTSVPRTIRFADTPANGYVDVPVSIRNGGCPTLTVQNIKVETTSSDDSEDGFALADGQATALTVLGGNAEPGVINVRFLPKAAGSIYKGNLTFETNDPDAADATVTIKLDGQGIAASLYLDKTLCDFTKLTGPCNGQIQVRNSGGKDLTLSKVSLKSSNPMFKLENADAFAGQVVPASGSFATLVQVTYVPSAQTGAANSDILLVESDAGPAECELRGGSPPVLKTTPVAILDFNASTGLPLDHTPHYEELKIENVLTYNEQLDLTLKDLQITDNRNTFSVVSSGALPAACPESELFAANKVVAPGGSFTACIKFESDLLGGSFSANLNILSSDPDFPDPSGLLMQLEAQATCEGKPTAAIEVRAQGAGSTCPCTEACPATATCAAKLPQMPATQGLVDVSGEASFSPVFTFDSQGQCVEDSRGAVAQYEWTLVSPADGSATISPEGKSGAAVTTLSYTKAGPHILKLKVYDAKGTGSNATQFTVNVSP